MSDATSKWHFYLSGWQRDGGGTVLLVRVCNQSDLTKDAEIGSALQQHLIAVNTGRHDALVKALRKLIDRIDYLQGPTLKIGLLDGELAAARAILDEAKP